ncbi:hypothetical protein P7K49_037775 [Saguinus oedipus]|uniref:Uncharacterized protein n=1 Tax=Saguinus oedipus TaxID=9490 RepID=A0ABQ9TKN4_SAGOE|nr:hypothetical protein P7K49_037775 [Saguinus oedipus]
MESYYRQLKPFSSSPFTTCAPAIPTHPTNNHPEKFPGWALLRHIRPAHTVLVHLTNTSYVEKTLPANIATICLLTHDPWRNQNLTWTGLLWLSLPRLQCFCFIYSSLSITTHVRLHNYSSPIEQLQSSVLQAYGLLANTNIDPLKTEWDGHGPSSTPYEPHSPPVLLVVPKLMNWSERIPHAVPVAKGLMAAAVSQQLNLQLAAQTQPWPTVLSMSCSSHRYAQGHRGIPPGDCSYLGSVPHCSLKPDADECAEKLLHFSCL